jgi:SCY1-like protein 2
MKDTNLLPYILPNVFAISQSLTPSQFAFQVLPSLKPLFGIKEPPQNMLTLLDNLTMLQDKTDKHVFREREIWICITRILSELPLDVLPLVYNALESDHAIVSGFGYSLLAKLMLSIRFKSVH